MKAHFVKALICKTERAQKLSDGDMSDPDEEFMCYALCIFQTFNLVSTFVPFAILWTNFHVSKKFQFKVKDGQLDMGFLVTTAENLMAPEVGNRIVGAIAPCPSNFKKNINIYQEYKKQLNPQMYFNYKWILFQSFQLLEKTCVNKPTTYLSVTTRKSRM